MNIGRRPKFSGPTENLVRAYRQVWYPAAWVEPPLRMKRPAPTLGPDVTLPPFELHMPIAVGHLCYDPTAPSVKRKAWWCILNCGPGWFWWLRPQLHKELPGTWMQAVDRDRVFGGQTVDRSPHLALIKPNLSPPAWGPHISILRGERPRKNEDVWKGKTVGPKWIRPGSPFEFEYEVTPHTNGHHWLLLVRSEKLGDLREFYGLSREPRVKFHLTFAIQTD